MFSIAEFGPSFAHHPRIGVFQMSLEFVEIASLNIRNCSGVFYSLDLPINVKAHLFRIGMANTQLELSPRKKWG